MLALALTVIVLAIPAATLPFVSLSKLGDHHEPRLASAITGLAQDGLPHLGALVAVSAIVAPLTLAALLVAWIWAARQRKKDKAGATAAIHRVIVVVQLWAMPEVYLLAVLISFVKLGDVVQVQARAGLWCYAAMAGTLIWAWRRYAGQVRAEADGVTPHVHP